MYVGARCELNAETPFQLLVATVLSAQCTDERVNKVTPELFAHYPNSKSMAKAPLQKIEVLIQSTGFFRNKAKNIKALSQNLESQFAGEVPQDIEQLTALPGVGRKTANVVLGNAFHIPSGIVVDTHVSRITQRLGWTQKTQPEAIEMDLETWIPKEDWIAVSHYLIQHGRRVCKARNPQCEECTLKNSCPSRLSLSSKP